MIAANTPYRILYVDDSPGDRRLFQEVLSDRPGVAISLAETGEQLVELVEKDELPSLILLDWNLPGLTGIDLLRRLKSDPLTRAIPVVVFTSSLPPERVAEIYNERANCIVEKPIGFDAFSELVLKIEEFWLRTSILPVNLMREASA
jgi:CheY-like chemotaxis protein